MARINLDSMDSTYLDILSEIGNIGSGNATTALAQMLNRKIDMSVPKVSLLGFNEICGSIGSEEDLLLGILFGIEGDISGMMMFLMKPDSAHNLTNALLGMSNDTNDFNEMELSAINEIGNIISGAYLNSIATLTNLKIISTIPSTTIDMAGAILSVPAIEFGKIGDSVLMIETQMGEGESVNGFFLLIPDLESYDKILAALHI
ncbi:MAG: chemotaxis protein CheC [Alistipes sp.]|nr:chemotaxis protein CheC [Alistipes sp.]